MSASISSSSRNPFLDSQSPFNPFRSRRHRSVSPNHSPAASVTELAPPPVAAAPPAREEPTPRSEKEPIPSDSESDDHPVAGGSTAASASAPVYAPPPGPPPRLPERNPSVPALPTRRPRSQSPIASERALTPPPEYTPGPDAQQGEQSVDFGPVRPFLPPPRVQPQPTGQTGNRLVPARLGQQPMGVRPSGTWSQYPGSLARHSTGWGNPPPIPPRIASHSTGALNDSGGPSGSNNGPPPGFPTQTPVPGHPLIRDGRVLVYPPDYECYKCHNLGYKNYDPTHPCSKCWRKYSTPFTGAITYAPWDRPTPDTNFQRPLPQFLGPPPRRPPLAPLGSVGLLSSSASFAAPPRALSGASVRYLNRAPPGATVVRPGDPRIGGRVCWNCGGDGLVSLFLFDSVKCQVCGGVGRVFT